MHPQNDWQADAAEMQAFSRRIHAQLKAHFGNRRLWKLLKPMKSHMETSQEVSMTLSKRSMLGAVLIGWLAVSGCAIVLGEVSSVFAISLFVPVAAVALVLLEWVIFPKLWLFKCRFILMRLERIGEKENVTFGIYVYAVAAGSISGFDLADWRLGRDLEEGDIVVGVIRGNDGLAQIPLRVEGRLSVLAWTRQLYQRNVFAPLPESLRQLAMEFDQYASHFMRMGEMGRQAEQAGKLKSNRPAKEPEQAWQGVVLEDGLKQRLIQMGQDFVQGKPSAPRGLLLYGPPGTGKTLIARALAESMDCAFFPLSLPDLKSQYIGESGERVKQLWDKALAKPRAVIFVDECEGVFSRRGAVNTDNFSADIVNAFIARWDGFGKQSSVLVVGASNRQELLDPAVKSRFDEQLHIGLPDGRARMAILRNALDVLGIHTPLPESAVPLSEGFSGRDLTVIAKRIAREIDQGSVLDDALLEAICGQLRSNGSTVVGKEASWDTLVLSEQTLRELKAVAGMLKHAGEFQARGVSIPRGLLLYGPPGTGKTQIARTLANETGLHFIAATTAELKQGFVGQSGQKVRELFARARENAPTLLFLDEIDSIAGMRDEGGDSFEREILGQLLQEMEGVRASPGHVFVLAATNRMDRIDPAILSRLPKQIEVPLPTDEEAQRLWQVMLRDKPLGFEIVETAAWLVEQYPGLAGRDIRNRIEQAEQNAVIRALENGDPASIRLLPEDFAPR